MTIFNSKLLVYQMVYGYEERAELMIEMTVNMFDDRGLVFLVGQFGVLQRGKRKSPNEKGGFNGTIIYKWMKCHEMSIVTFDYLRVYGIEHSGENPYLPYSFNYYIYLFIYSFIYLFIYLFIYSFLNRYITYYLSQICKPLKPFNPATGAGAASCFRACRCALCGRGSRGTAGGSGGSSQPRRRACGAAVEKCCFNQQKKGMAPRKMLDFTNQLDVLPSEKMVVF